MALHPKNPEVGEKTIQRSSKVYVEAVDAADVKAGDIVTFVNWGNLKIKEVKKNGVHVEEIKAQLNLDNKVKTRQNTNYKIFQDFKKTLKVTWLGESKNTLEGVPVKAIEYDHIISKAIIGKDDDWMQFINEKSMVRCSAVHFFCRISRRSLESRRCAT